MEGITYCLVSVSVFIWKIVIRRDTCSLTICKALRVNPIIWLTSTAHRTHSYIHIILSLILSFSVVVYICASAIRAPLCPLNRQALRSLTLIRIVHLVETTSTIYSLYGGVYSVHITTTPRICLLVLPLSYTIVFVYKSRALFNVSYIVFHFSRSPRRVRMFCVLPCMCIGNDFYFTFNVKMVPRSIDSIYDYISVLFPFDPPILLFHLLYLSLFCTSFFSLSTLRSLRQLPFPFCLPLHILIRVFFSPYFHRSKLDCACVVYYSHSRPESLFKYSWYNWAFVYALAYSTYCDCTLWLSLALFAFGDFFFVGRRLMELRKHTHTHTHVVQLRWSLCCHVVMLPNCCCCIVHLSFICVVFCHRIFFSYSLSPPLSLVFVSLEPWRWSWSCSVGYCCLVLRIICKQLPISMFNVIQHIFLIYLFLFGSIKLS